MHFGLSIAATVFVDSSSVELAYAVQASLVSIETIQEPVYADGKWKEDAGMLAGCRFGGITAQ